MTTIVNENTKERKNKGCKEPGGCTGDHAARGYCIKHYVQHKPEFKDIRPHRKHNLTDDELREHIKENVEIDEQTGCWNWTDRSRDTHGYGTISYNDPEAKTRRPIRVHRLSYLLFNGPLVKGQHVDHKCHNETCCNPEHLRQVPPAGNAQNKRGLMPSNTSGYTGVYFMKQIGRWGARIGVNGKSMYLGSFAEKDEAIRARKDAEAKYHPFMNTEYVGDVAVLPERVTRTDNPSGRILPINNTSGRIGVCRVKDSSKWYAQIGVNGKVIGLGYWDTFEEAVIAREKAEAKYRK